MLAPARWRSRRCCRRRSTRRDPNRSGGPWWPLRAGVIGVAAPARASVRSIALVAITGPPFGDGHATIAKFPLGPWISVTEVDPATAAKSILELGSTPYIEILLVVSKLGMLDFSQSNSGTPLRDLGANRDQAGIYVLGEVFISKGRRIPLGVMTTVFITTLTNSVAGSLPTFLKATWPIRSPVVLVTMPSGLTLR